MGPEASFWITLGFCSLLCQDRRVGYMICKALPALTLYSSLHPVFLGLLLTRDPVCPAQEMG